MKHEVEDVLYNDKKNVIWGAGGKGVETLLKMAAMGIYVELFCDSDERKQRIRICNKKVIYPEDLLRNCAEYNIIVAIDKKLYVQEVINILAENNIKYITWQDVCEDYELSGFEIRSLYRIIQDSYKKKIMVYGSGEEAGILKRVLTMLDVEVLYLVDTLETAYEYDGDNIVKPVCDLLYEEADTYKVVVTGNGTRKNVSALDKIGLKIGVDYDYCNQYYPFVTLREGVNVLDPSLGYTFRYKKEGENIIPGFVEYGEDGDFVLVLLGNSTTDGKAYYFKTWGEILYEKFRDNGYRVKIVNGGCGGYQSSQELIKLIRDIIPMRPDGVIQYTGVNELARTVEHYPFIHTFQNDMMKQTPDLVKANYLQLKIRGGAVAEYVLGAEDCRPRWERFADNIRMAGNICRGFGIKYRAFLQPSFPTKIGKFSIYEQEMMYHDANISDKLLNEMSEFYGNIRQAEIENLEDITWLFDDVENVYLDVYHVTEQGNEMIAQYIYDYFIRNGIVKKPY